MKRVVLLQSNYLPWRGYLDLCALSDEFVVYDSCQYTVNDWRNRNRIKTGNGLTWLTVPVLTKGRTGQRIDEARIAERGWVTKQLRTIEQALGRAPHFDLLASTVLDALGASADAALLHDVNRSTLVALARVLGLDTPFTLDGDYGEVEGDPSERVAELVHRAGGTHYLTGPAGLAYLRRAPFAEREVTIEVIDYSTLAPYPQLHGEFESSVSAIDLIANCGPDAGQHLTSTVRSVVEADDALTPGEEIVDARR